MTLENKKGAEINKDEWWILYVEEKKGFLHGESKNFSLSSAQVGLATPNFLVDIDGRNCSSQVLHLSPSWFPVF